MAEITTSDNKANKRKTHKKSTKVDLTPMVDLGFLLITFFVFTTTITQTKAMQLDLPANGDKTPIANSGALSIVLGKNNTVYYYEGMLQPNGANLKTTSFKQIRDIIIDKKKIAKHNLFIVIKPSDGCDYKNLIDILDEMTINVINHYALDEETSEEIKIINTLEKKYLHSF